MLIDRFFYEGRLDELVTSDILSQQQFLHIRCIFAPVPTLIRCTEALLFTVNDFFGKDVAHGIPQHILAIAILLELCPFIPGKVLIDPFHILEVGQLIFYRYLLCEINQLII